MINEENYSVLDTIFSSLMTFEWCPQSTKNMFFDNLMLFCAYKYDTSTYIPYIFCKDFPEKE